MSEFIRLYVASLYDWQMVSVFGGMRSFRPVSTFCRLCFADLFIACLMRVGSGGHVCVFWGCCSCSSWGWCIRFVGPCCMLGSWGFIGGYVRCGAELSIS